MCVLAQRSSGVVSLGWQIVPLFDHAASLVGQDNDTTGHLQNILAQIGSFCLVSIGIFIVAEILVLYAGFRYNYCRGLNSILAQIGSFCLVSIRIFVIAEILVLYASFRYNYHRSLNNILVLLIGGIPVTMSTILSVTSIVAALSDTPEAGKFITHGLHALAVVYKELDGDDPEAEGNGFELVFLPPPILPMKT